MYFQCNYCTFSFVANIFASNITKIGYGLHYTTLRLPQLNDRNEVKYSITTHNEPYIGVSGSRKSNADAILKIVRNPELQLNRHIDFNITKLSNRKKLDQKLEESAEKIGFKVEKNLSVSTPVNQQVKLANKIAKQNTEKSDESLGL